MTRNSKPFRFFDFSGGLNTAAPVTSLKMNEALDLQNINLLPSGGFEKRRGNTAFNSSAMESGAAIHGLGYYRQADADEWLITVCGTKMFKSEFDGTMDDITGAVTITTGQNNVWMNTTFNDISIWVGGVEGTWDAPIKWGGSGNAAALGGSPPSGGGIITANNRVFIYDIASNRSRIQWPILGNPEDWTGTGSGSQDVSKNDGDTLVVAAQVGLERLLLLKQNSIHELAIRTAPFPVFELRRGPNIGAISKRGAVVVDNLVYYVTPEPRMKATNGTEIMDFPSTIDDVWDGLNKSRLKYIQGVYYPRLRQIMWICSNGSSTTHNYCIIWDLDRKCWLRHPTGYKMNTAVLAQDRVLYAGAYDGKIYKQDVASTYTDASETSPGAISAYWRSGWLDIETMLDSKVPPYAELNFVSQASGTFEFGYGFDFSADRRIVPISMVTPGALYGAAIYGVDVYGGQSDKMKFVHMKGQGQHFQFLLRNMNPSEGFAFNGMEIPIKAAAVSASRA